MASWCREGTTSFPSTRTTGSSPRTGFTRPCAGPSRPRPGRERDGTGASGKDFRLAQGRAFGVLGGQAGLPVKTPVDADLWIVPGDAALVLGRVVVGGLVEEVRALAEHDESVGEARGHPHLALVLFAQLLADPLPEGGRTPAQVHGDVEDGAAHDTHEFPLGLADLVMQAAQDAARTAAVVVLYESVAAAGGFVEGALVETLEEETASVAEHLGLEDDDVGNARGKDVHGKALDRWRGQKALWVPISRPAA